MGIADVIPGVSGGTMALILGIYARLISAIRHMDLELLPALLKGAFHRRLFARLLTPLAPPSEDPVLARADAAAFLAVLLTGIVVAVLTGARFIPSLMQNHPEIMRGFFLGLVLVSVFAPIRHMREQHVRPLSIFLVVAATPASLLTLPTDQSSFANGEITLTRGPSTPPGELHITPTMRWVVESNEEEGKYGLSFRPLGGSVQWDATEPSITVPVIATRTGSDGNFPAGSKLAFRASPPPFPTLSIHNESPLEGGVEPSLGWIFTCGAIAICAMILPGLSGSFLLLLLGQYDFILFQLHRLLQGDVNSAGPHVGIFLIGITVGILSFSRLLHALLARAHDGTMAALAGLMIGSLYKLWPWQTPSLTGDIPLAPIDGLVLGPAVACLIGMTLVGVFLHMDRDRVESSTAPPRSA